jgi:acetyl esterase
MTRAALLTRISCIFLMAAPNFLSAAPRFDIEYSRVGEVSLLLDAHLPESPGPHPALVMVHGGAWVAGDRSRNLEPLFRPLNRAGFACFTISYRFATDPLLFGAAIEDVRHAVRFVHKYAAEYDVDPSRIALLGESAGAQLASMAVLGDPALPVRAVAAFYSPSDLASLATESRQVPQSVRQALSNAGLGELILWRLRDLSPVNHVSRIMPPFLLLHGTSDPVVPYQQSVQFCERATSAGGTCELYTVKGGSHGFRYWHPAYQARLIAWLTEKLDTDSR